MRFDRGIGNLASLRHADVEILARGPLVQLWRGATDNDGLKLWHDQGGRALGRWQDLGLHKLQHRAEGISWKMNRDGSASVEVRHAASGRDRWRDCSHRHCYTLHPGGALVVDNDVRLGTMEMTDLPRIGVRLDLQPGFESLAYFGRGPWENYADRKASALVGLFETTVQDTYVPYVMPQEHGHRTDVRWLRLADAQGRSITVGGDPCLEFNATHLTAEDLYAARHTTDLVPRPETILYLDCAHRGLGTGSCGPDTRPEYRLLRKRYSWRVRISTAG
jgi:beta-galactosidase